MTKTEPQLPVRPVRYAVQHAISGYMPDSAPAYFTNKRQARAYAVEEVGQYLEALGAYDDNGRRYRVGHDNHVSVSKEGPDFWRLTAGQGISRYVCVEDISGEDVYVDDDGDFWQRHVRIDLENESALVTWEEITDW